MASISDTEPAGLSSISGLRPAGGGRSQQSDVDVSDGSSAGSAAAADPSLVHQRRRSFFGRQRRKQKKEKKERLQRWLEADNADAEVEEEEEEEEEVKEPKRGSAMSAMSARVSVSGHWAVKAFVAPLKKLKGGLKWFVVYITLFALLCMLLSLAWHAVNAHLLWKLTGLDHSWVLLMPPGVLSLLILLGLLVLLYQVRVDRALIRTPARSFVCASHILRLQVSSMSEEALLGAVHKALGVDAAADGREGLIGRLDKLDTQIEQAPGGLTLSLQAVASV